MQSSYNYGLEKQPLPLLTICMCSYRFIGPITAGPTPSFFQEQDVILAYAMCSFLTYRHLFVQLPPMELKCYKGKFHPKWETMLTNAYLYEIASLWVNFPTGATPLKSMELCQEIIWSTVSMCILCRCSTQDFF